MLVAALVKAKYPDRKGRWIARRLQDTATRLAALGVERAVLVGHSMGGFGWSRSSFPPIRCSSVSSAAVTNRRD